jgi:hypothetical protein
MSTINKTIALSFLALLACSIAVAHTDGIYNPTANSVGSFEGIDSNAGAVVQPTGDVLMVDGVSLILQTDAASFVCRAGGC